MSWLLSPGTAAHHWANARWLQPTIHRKSWPNLVRSDFNSTCGYWHCGPPDPDAYRRARGPRGQAGACRASRSRPRGGVRRRSVRRASFCAELWCTRAAVGARWPDLGAPAGGKERVALQLHAVLDRFSPYARPISSHIHTSASALAFL